MILPCKIEQETCMLNYNGNYVLYVIYKSVMFIHVWILLLYLVVGIWEWILEEGTGLNQKRPKG